MLFQSECLRYQQEPKVRKDTKTKDCQTNLGGGLRLLPKEPPKVAPKMLNRSAGFVSTLLLDRACRMLTMGASLSLVSFSLMLSLSLSRTIGDERGEFLEREDEFMIEMADSCDRPKIRRRILVEFSVISPYGKP